MSRVTTIRDALVSMLQGIDGSGDYTLDLSTRTHKGQPPMQSLPTGGSAYIWRGPADWKRGENAPVNAWDTRVQWNVSIFGVTGADSESREEWLDTAEADLLTAIDAALSTGGALASASVMDVDGIVITPLYGSQPNAPDPVGIWATFVTLDISGDGVY